MPIRVKTPFKGIDFDFRQFKKSVEESCKRQRNNALREFLKTIITQIPIVTGTAAGTLIPLSRLVNMALNIQSKADKPKKGPSVGASKATASLRQDTKGASFSWNLNLSYFIFNDITASPGIYANPQRETPWKLIKEAQEAAKAHLAKYAKRDMPRVSQFIRKIK